MDRGDIGQYGEEIACKHLKRKGYRVLERNYRKPWGELDIVTKGPDGTLVFVEVKTMREGRLKPEDQMSRAKILKLRRTCSLFANEHTDLFRDRKGWRIDLIAVTLKYGGGEDIQHYENMC